MRAGTACGARGRMCIGARTAAAGSGTGECGRSSSVRKAVALCQQHAPVQLRAPRVAAHRMTQGAPRRRARASALAADASLSLRPWMTSTGKPAAAAMQAASSMHINCRKEFSHGSPIQQRATLRDQQEATAQGVGAVHQLPPSAALRTRGDGCRVPVAQPVAPACQQLALEAVRRLRGPAAVAGHVLAPQQFLAVRREVRHLRSGTRSGERVTTQQQRRRILAPQQAGSGASAGSQRRCAGMHKQHTQHSTHPGLKRAPAEVHVQRGIHRVLWRPVAQQA